MTNAEIIKRLTDEMINLTFEAKALNLEGYEDLTSEDIKGLSLIMELGIKVGKERGNVHIEKDIIESTLTAINQMQRLINIVKKPQIKQYYGEISPDENTDNIP